MDDPNPPRFHTIEANRFVPDACRRIFDGDTLVCVAASTEYAAMILAMLNRQEPGAEIDPERMNAAGKAFNAATKKKLKAAILAYLAPPERLMADDIAF